MLSQEQLEQLDALINETILPTLQQGGNVTGISLQHFINPDMSDIQEEALDYDDIWNERSEELLQETTNYITEHIFN
jgi:hypothetical protein